MHDPCERFAQRLAARIGMDATFAQRLYRFVITGVGSTLVYFAVMGLGVSRLGFSVTLASTFAFVAGGAFSYLFNTLWGFSSEISRRTASRFLLVTLFSFSVCTAAAWLLDRLGVHYGLISLLVAPLGAACNFVGHVVFTYRRRVAGRPPSAA